MPNKLDRDIQLSRLLDMDHPQTVLAEVRTVIRMTSTGFDFDRFDALAADIIDLFEGRYPGFRRCNTAYHDLKHTTDATLAAARLIHASTLAGAVVGPKALELGLLCALGHDTGYIQAIDDRQGSGAKYTLTHIERSIDFMQRWLKAHGFDRADTVDCRDILTCTGLQTRIGRMAFSSPDIATMGKILGSADLLGQMADRTYLEKLPFLYREFREGGLETYTDERDLLEKTLGFYEITKKRLDGELGGVHRQLVRHFQQRWDIARDLYTEAIEKNIAYLRFILQQPDRAHRRYLRRGDFMQRLETDGTADTSRK